MGDYSLSLARAASAIIVIAALSLYPTLGLYSAAENAKSSEDALRNVAWPSTLFAERPTSREFIASF
jgi:hypothetical protein